MNIPAIAKRFGETVKANSPAILTALGASGIAATGYLAAKAGYRASDRVWIKADSEEGITLTRKDILQETWDLYIPALLAGGASVACVIALNSIHNRRTASLMTAVTLGETAFREYREKVIETVGKAKDEKISERIAQDRVNSSTSEVVFVGDDKQLCFDVLTGRYFESTRNDIEKAANEFNRLILNEMYASQNEWYDMIGLGRVAMGDELGWNNDHPLELVFSAVLKEDKPVMAIDYRFRPQPTFSHFG